jgi:NAD(P)-dependent dehydrogenase (short-subunit alcohol dehydrogenase family)
MFFWLGKKFSSSLFPLLIIGPDVCHTNNHKIINLAKLFIEEGAYVFITGRRQEMLDKAVKEIDKNNVTGVQGDAGNLADLDRLFEIVKKEKGHIDVLFASAGYGELGKPLGSITLLSIKRLSNREIT